MLDWLKYPKSFYPHMATVDKTQWWCNFIVYALIEYIFNFKFCSTKYYRINSTTIIIGWNEITMECQSMEFANDILHVLILYACFTR